MDDATGVLVRYKLDVHAYHRMGETGILDEDSRIELIDGELIQMAPIGLDHAGIVDSLNEALVLAFAGKAIVSVQNPISIDRLNEPQPDFTVSRLRADRYRTGRPGPADILLVIEVADSSLRFDRAVKLPLYARNGVAELWIVNVRQRSLEVYRRPVGDAYAEQTNYAPGDTVALSLAPAISFAVDRVLNLP